MLRIKMDAKTDRHMVHCESTGIELVAEMAGAISILYMRLRQCNPEAAESFREKLIRCLVDPRSPVWTEDATKDSGYGVAACIPLKHKEEN